MTRPRWDELGEGFELPPLQKPPIERIQLVKYAGASGDFNRIHVEEDYARAAGYKSVFAHGMLVMGFLGQLVGDFSGGPAGILKISCRFRAITWPGDVITCRGRVSKKEAATQTVELSVQAVNQDGTVVADGTATVRLPKA
ncbi:MAG TPA: MaoC/PaaZ C-terminal domain-containing protein [Polyangia bacterium]|nr:MaoC/PaaZ C-terminal domain-containing protein [Polyangia bacterium]